MGKSNGKRVYLTDICPQLEGETSAAYAAFGVYAMLGEKRSIPKALEYYEINKVLPKLPSRRTFEHYSLKNKWVERAQKWDKYRFKEAFVLETTERQVVVNEIRQNALTFYRALTPKIKEMIAVVAPIDREIRTDDGTVISIPATKASDLKAIVETTKLHYNLGEYAGGISSNQEAMRTIDALTHLVDQGIAPEEQVAVLQAGLLSVVEDVKRAANAKSAAPDDSAP